MAHRQALLDLIGRYRPIDEEDAAAARRLAAFVERTPGCFDRATVEGHVTGSAWLVDAEGRRVLLTHHRKLDKWLQLGGHADGEADVLAVALREAREESGLDDVEPLGGDIFDLDIHRIPARADEPEHWHYDVRFAMRAAGKSEFRVGPESRALAWVEIEKLESATREASMLRMKRKWLLDGRRNFFSKK